VEKGTILLQFNEDKIGSRPGKVESHRGHSAGPLALEI